MQSSICVRGCTMSTGRVPPLFLVSVWVFLALILVESASSAPSDKEDGYAMAGKSFGGLENLFG